MDNFKKCWLILEDGVYFQGKAFGSQGSKIGEVIFNTSITGYQEILTDPSYYEQIVVMTYPLIGNYGINTEDVESDRVQVKGFVVREISSIASNQRATGGLEEYLERYDVPGIWGIDTRAITRHIRIKGAMKGAIVAEKDMDSIENWVGRIREYPDIVGRNIVKDVSCKKPYLIKGRKDRFTIVVVDCGVKKSILDNLAERVENIWVMPWNSTPEEVLAKKPLGVLISNGPGDPAAVKEAIELVRKLIGKLPIWGICLGQQIIGLALGGKTYKLKFGHHGGNHPVKDLSTGRIDITAQNHNFCVDLESIPAHFEVVQTHKNLYDNTLEGIYSKKYKIRSVQYHPEAGPGPNDAKHIFDEFIEELYA